MNRYARSKVENISCNFCDNTYNLTFKHHIEKHGTKIPKPISERKRKYIIEFSLLVKDMKISETKVSGGKGNTIFNQP